MPHIHINIGSNQGDRAAQIERAVAALCRRLDPSGSASVTVAPIEETEPWGYESACPFLNLGLMVDMPGDVDPFYLLRMLQETEKEIADVPHRHTDGSYADRPIDIDLIAVGDMTAETAELQLPHPRMHLRPFVLRPLALLDPAWRHPVTGQTASEMLSLLSE